MGQDVVGQNFVGQDVTRAISLGQNVVGQDVAGAISLGQEVSGAGGSGEEVGNPNLQFLSTFFSNPTFENFH